MTLVLRYSARSDRGLVRQNNQDAVYAGPRLLALADGMGGHAAGEVASSLVISALAPLDEDDPGDDLLAELREATVEGNSAITRHVADSPDLEGMGTTLTAILFAGSRLGLVHVGDSRAYQLRDGTLSQITKDDTFVQSLIDEGRITEEEAHTHPQRSLLLRAITGQDIEPSLTMREARPGDRYLLCSDGLSGVVSDETLADTLMTYRDPRECADRMIELALRGGGPDNITCIVADVVDIDFGDDAPIVGGSVGDGRDEGPRPDSAAARASATTMTRALPRVEQAPAVAPAGKRRGLRVLAVALAVLVVLGAAGALARVWVLQQYYVGVDGRQVAIFQGVRGNVLGLPLHEVAEHSEITTDELTESDRSQVENGILPTASGIEGARSVVSMLRDRLLKPCPVISATATPTPPATAPAVPPPAAPPPAAPPPAAPAPAAPAPAAPAPAPGQPPAPTTVNTTPLPQASNIPGVTCRTLD